MTKLELQSWGRVIGGEYDTIDFPAASSSFPAVANGETILPFGAGRSYGDSCLNPGGALLRTKYLDHFIGFDPKTGVLSCEAAVQLADILKVCVPQGWFLPVTPGTRFVTIGGAIANDVHGKNHHRNGTFGCHVRRFELLRSDNTRRVCSPDENADWFAATIGGLGLTGLITWAELQLQPVSGAWMNAETLHFSSLDAFMELTGDSDDGFEYTVSWLDCTNPAGAGIFMRANHAAGTPAKTYQPRRFCVPLPPPLSLINNVSVRIFNRLYSQKPDQAEITHYEPFFYPLDALGNWNRLYGPKGFYQYQFVVPAVAGLDPIKDALRAIGRNGIIPALSVLKSFGGKKSPGLLSFPIGGVTLALDFPNAGAALHKLFAELDDIVRAAQGRIYPAKDGRMPGELFRSGYPAYKEFSAFVDPRFSSGFWRRVMESA